MKSLITLTALTALSLSIVADELHMKNGSKLIGTLVKAEDNTVVFKTPFSDNIIVKEENISWILTEEPVIIMLEDGLVYRDRQINVSETALVAIRAGEEPIMFVTSDIRMVNPEPWKLGEGYNWAGDFKAKLESERGNSDSDEWDVDGRMVWTSLKDRYQIDGELELDKTNDVTTKEQWKIRSKYDRFSVRNPKNYYGAKLRFEYDRFEDLDLRTIIGPHIGRQFFDSSLLALHAELGAAWVDEKFDEADDNEYPGTLWEIEANSDIVGFGTEVYIIHDGILNFNDSGNLILNTRVGIKMPLIYKLQTGFEAKYEYDGGAVEGADELDTTYNFVIGITW